MIDFSEIKTTAKELLEFAEKKEGVKEVEAYVSCNSLNVYRIVYHSGIPSNGLEEPKSEENFGLSLRILFEDGKFGFGSADSDLSKKGFDEGSNYHMGIKEVGVFPDIRPDELKLNHGIQISFITNTIDRESNLELFKSFSFPFTK